MSEFLLPEPSYIGLPYKFSVWRTGQDKAILRSVESDKRFVALACPTGFGKSLVYIASALLSGQRVCVLTSTKGLQSQLIGDFAISGLVDIRGQNNYPCLYSDGSDDTVIEEDLTCEEGPCHCGVICNLQKSGCTYFDAARSARHSKLVVTNYYYWMRMQQLRMQLEDECADQKELEQKLKRFGIGTFGMLVMDEAHDALSCLGDHLSVELWAHELERFGWDMSMEADFTTWKAVARRTLIPVTDLIDELSDEVRKGNRRRVLLKEIRSLKSLESKLSRLATANEDWVFQSRRQGKHAQKVVRFDPVWPAEYSEDHLFGGIKRVVFTSATITRKTLALLGCDPFALDFVEYPSSFPLDHRPVYWIPTVRVDKNATPAHLNSWVAKMDAIIAQRLDRKGLIHSVSFEKAQLIARRSQYSDIMLLNQSGTTQSVVDEFRRSKPPRILVSPSISTGYDFPFDQARYQIVAKLPFPDSRNLVLKARTEKDKLYGIYEMVQNLVQMCGRIVRSEEDYGESFVVDDHFQWIFNRHKNLMPRWFTEAVKMSRTIPPPKELS